MALLATLRKKTYARLVIGVLGIVVVTAACSSSSDSAVPTAEPASPSITYAAAAVVVDDSLEGLAGRVIAGDGSVVFQATSQKFDAKIIRDGRLDIRIDEGTFGSKAEELRTIAADLGGYIASGETYIEQLEDGRYAVGWYTMRIPSDRFDDAVSRVERMGDPVSASLSSQDVTEEYVDLQGRLDYWRTQEQFYLRLLEEASTVEDLILVQTRMQEVLLTIEQIEGRLRYLDSRTDFATLTVGMTEVPDTIVDHETEPTLKGPIAEAFDQAGEVLLGTVAFLIVATAVVVPMAIVALIVYGIIRLVTKSTGRKDEPTPANEPDSSDESDES